MERKSPFILTMPIMAKAAEHEVAPVNKEMLIWKNKEVVLEALNAFKQDIAYLATTSLFSADDRMLKISLPGNMIFEYSSMTQRNIDAIIEFLNKDKFNAEGAYVLKHTETIKKALTCSLRNKLHTWALEGTAKDVNTEMALLYIL